jgi:hypothetical protein
MEVSHHHGPQQEAALRKRSTKYVGLDVHQATTVASVREDGGRVIAHTVVPTEAAALLELFVLCGWLAGPRLDERDVHVAADQGKVRRVERDDRRTKLACRGRNENVLEERPLRQSAPDGRARPEPAIDCRGPHPGAPPRHHEPPPGTKRLNERAVTGPLTARRLRADKDIRHHDRTDDQPAEFSLMELL